MKRIGFLAILFLISILHGISQDYLLNPSFEGTLMQMGCPPDWDTCSSVSTPNVQPGLYGVYMTPSDGNTYLGLLTRVNGTVEDCYTTLNIPLSKDSCYKFEIDLCFWEAMGNYPYVDPIVIRIFGAEENCVKDNILWSSPVIDNTDWETFEFIIHNDAYDITEINIEADFAQPYWYKGYMLLDNIRITQFPQFELGNDTTLTLCSFDSLILDPGPGFETFLWQDGSENQTYTVDTTGLYWVQAFNEYGCSWTDSVYVTVEEYLDMESTMIDSTLVCEGQEVTLFATIELGAEPYSYQWLNLPDTTESITVIVEQTMYYPVLITDDCGLELLDSIKVVMMENPDVDLGPDTLICPDGNYTLHAGAGYAEYSWHDGSNDSTCTVLYPGTYWVEVTSSFGCIGRDTVEIDLFPPVPLNLGNDTILCNGESVTFYAGSEFLDFTWQDGSTDSTYTATNTGLYWVTVTDEHGCQRSDTIYAEFLPLPIANLGPDTSMCNGESILLDGGAEFISYLWQDNDTSQFYNVTSGGWYSVTVGNGCGEDTDSVYVEEYPAPDIDLGQDTTICEGNSLTLDVGNGYASYLWQDNSTSSVYYVTESGYYSVAVTNFYNCESTDDIFVDVSSPFVSLGPDTSLCYHDSLYLDPGSFESYLWQDGSELPTYHVVNSGIYSVNVLDAFGCPGNAEVELIILTVPQLDLGADQPLCSGETITIDAPIGPYTYIWNGVEGTASLEVSSGGDYTLQLVNVCGEDTDNVYVTEYETPEPYLGVDIVLFPDESVEIDAGTGYDTYLWQDGSSYQYLNVEANDLDNENPWFYVEVSNGPCKGSDTLEIILFKVELPNVFTPNNDQKNDYFLPMPGSWSGITDHYISIFNRWGEKVWESENMEDGWDGKRDGTVVADGTYFWVLEVFYGPENIKQVQKGTVTVVGSEY